MNEELLLLVQWGNNYFLEIQLLPQLSTSILDTFHPLYPWTLVVQSLHLALNIWKVGLLIEPLIIKISIPIPTKFVLIVLDLEEKRGYSIERKYDLINQFTFFFAHIDVNGESVLWKKVAYNINSKGKTICSNIFI